MDRVVCGSRARRATVIAHRGVATPRRPVYIALHAGIAQLVEHNLAKVGVAGSSPVSRSLHIESGAACAAPDFALVAVIARVAKWQTRGT